MKSILIACADNREGYWLHKFLQKEHPRWPLEKAESIAEIRAQISKMTAGIVVCDFTFHDGNMMSTIMENLEDTNSMLRFVLLGQPHVKEGLKWLLACSRRFTFLTHPVDLDSFCNHVSTVWITTADAVVSGIALPSFLQALSMELKTCVLEVSTSEGEGSINLENGRIVHAVYGGFMAEDAVFEMCRCTVTQMRLFIGRLGVRDIDVGITDLLLRYFASVDENAALA
ncbi:MAG: DUF4388 domain-containing protein [Candidatus Methylacidiphilales bacterium]|nr:DUF4388 domain-containing protein [Candidatus Methylacidiphilales bacterium]